MKKQRKKLLCAVLSLVLLLGLAPAVAQPAQAVGSAAGGCVEIYVGTGRIGNSGYDATDMFYNFSSGTAGFAKSTSGGDIAVNGNTVRMGTPKDSATFTLTIANNPVLQMLARSSTAQYRVHGRVQGTDDDFHAGTLHDDNDRARIKINGTTYAESKKEEDAEDTVVNYDTGWLSLSGRSTITIRAENEHWCDGWDGYSDNCEGDTYIDIYLEMRDTGCPTMSYTTSHNGTVNPNNDKELLIKLGTKDVNDPDNRYYTASQYDTLTEAKNSREYVDMAFSFSKPVTISSVNNNGGMSVSQDDLNRIAYHKLFNNTLGTGYIGQGDERGLYLYKVSGATGGTYVIDSFSYTGGTVVSQADMMNRFINSMNFRYSATRGDFNGNNPIAAGGSIETNGGLLSQINAAGFHDAAGNPVTGIGGGCGNNIFDRNDGGYDVIVDAEPPTLTRVGNGVTPDVLTDLVLNDGDSVDFVVSFSEAVITRRDFSESNTYLMMDNGVRAYYQDKSGDGKQWTFHYDVDASDAEATVWKVIALTNNSLDGQLSESTGGGAGGKEYNANHTFNADARTVTDYVGNLMSDRMNRTHNEDQVESSTEWANLMVDNTAPELEFQHEIYGSGTLSLATDQDWGQGAKIFVSATDADIPVADYDPELNSGLALTQWPSRGVYRPGASTGSDESFTAAGLFFYIWTRSETPPDTGTNFEAIKRYSLSGEQPKSVAGAGYAASWAAEEDILHMANNFGEVVPFNDNMMTEENDGVWYLHVWTADMTWDSARQRMQYELASSLQFNPGYSETAVLAYKMAQVDRYRSDHTVGDSTPSYDDALEAVLPEVYETVYTSGFLGWLDDSGSNRYSADAMAYAQTQALLQVASYENTNVWSLSKFTYADSNWVTATVRLLLDDTLPAPALFDYDNTTGNGTSDAVMPFTLCDAMSGIDPDEVYYQWAPAGAQPAEVDWMKLSADQADEAENGTGFMTGLSSITFSVHTQGSNIHEDGEYVLWVRFSDMAANTVISQAEQSVQVSASLAVGCTFGPEEALRGYQQSVSPEVLVQGIRVRELKYAVSDSASAPEDDNLFQAVEPDTNDTDGVHYVLPELNGDAYDDGTWYVHVLIVEDAAVGSNTYSFSQSYRLDNTPPTVYFSPNGMNQPQLSIDAVVSASDDLSGVMSGMKYQLNDSEQLLGGDGAGWPALPASGKVTIQKSATGAYYLHVWVSDNAGNGTEVVSRPYQIRGSDSIPLPEYGTSMLTTYTQDGVTYGVANVTLNTESKDGYRFSISDDGGATWCNWLPYMSMTRFILSGSANTGALMVKLRSPSGEVSEPAGIGESAVTNPIWATAEFDSMVKRQPGQPLTLLMRKPDDVTVTPITDGILDLENGNFSVSDNGVYEFSLMRGETPATDHLVIVVDLFDTMPPAAYISYSNLAPTGGSVTATVSADEPIYVKEIQVGGNTLSGRSSYIFQENGSCVFVIQDEAGNTAQVTATVDNIDRSGPDVEIVRDYSGFRSVTTGAGQTVASGVKLTVSKDPYGNGKEFTVVTNDQKDTMTVKENGTYSFTVRDSLGNTTTESVTVDNLVGSLPAYTVQYTYSNGTPVREGVYRRDDVDVTVTFEPSPVGLKLYSGTAPVDGAVLSGNSFTRTYSSGGSTVLAFCDELGNVVRIPITVIGVDKTPPRLSLNSSSIIISLPVSTSYVLSRLTEEQLESLGGFVVSDDVSEARDISVSVRRSDRKTTLSGQEAGQFTLVYTATDQAGNQTMAEQKVFVIPADGLMVTADGILLSGAAVNNAILPDNHVTFYVDPVRIQTMFYRNTKVQNSKMRYDIYYVSGLYREGQLKTIATKVTSEELAAGQYQVTFPKPGWYTIIIRNQERTRTFTTFFVSSVT